jgi:hypothetical protein
MTSIYVSIVGATRPSDDDQSTSILDPGLLLEQLPQELRATDSKYSIIIKSDVIMLKVDSNIFLSKVYRIDGENLYINGRKLDLTDLKITIQFELEIQ